MHMSRVRPGSQEGRPSEELASRVRGPMGVCLHSPVAAAAIGPSASHTELTDTGQAAVSQVGKP